MRDLSKSFDIDRDPSGYDASTHLLQQLREDDRKVIDGEMITEAIEEGSVVKADGNEGGSDEALTLRHQWLMTTFEVVICPSDRVIQTAYEVEG